LKGGKDDGYSNSLIETMNSCYKVELILRRARGKRWEVVDSVALEWACWLNRHQLMEPIGHISPADAEMHYIVKFRVKDFQCDANQDASQIPGSMTLNLIRGV